MYTLPMTAVGVAGKSAKLYTDIMVYVNGVKVQNLAVTESTRKYDYNIGQYYKISSVEIPACDPGDIVKIQARILFDHAWYNSVRVSDQINPAAGKYYTLFYTAEKTIENTYTISGSLSTSGNDENLVTIELIPFDTAMAPKSLCDRNG